MDEDLLRSGTCTAYPLHTSDSRSALEVATYEVGSAPDEVEAVWHTADGCIVGSGAERAGYPYIRAGDEQQTRVGCRMGTHERDQVLAARAHGQATGASE